MGVFDRLSTIVKAQTAMLLWRCMMSISLTQTERTEAEELKDDVALFNDRASNRSSF